jgi:hypothetical protein
VVFAPFLRTAAEHDEMDRYWWWIVDLLTWIAYFVGPSLVLLAAIVLSLFVAFWTLCIDPGFSAGGS